MPVCVSVPETSKLPLRSTVVAVMFTSPEELIARSVPSPSIFSPSSPKVMPTPDGTLTSAVAVRLMSAPEVIVKSVLSPSIFSPVPKVIPTLAGITTSVPAVRFIAPSEAMSSVASALELTEIAVSRNCIFLFVATSVSSDMLSIEAVSMFAVPSINKLRHS